MDLLEARREYLDWCNTLTNKQAYALKLLIGKKEMRQEYFEKTIHWKTQESLRVKGLISDYATGHGLYIRIVPDGEKALMEFEKKR
ncbi:hypothetical protein LCGC14_0370860 [marine sediment metagenome]|uniref:Uncharacterized protein n=1 Tax=marine sediment metagenome TaxID=412755 RepID=A0A0F9T5C0_9ZZZZ|nr:hypothetical protein [Maribacter sp.]HDZ04848.1 hypothetical protein [Maribacter sp.]